MKYTIESQCDRDWYVTVTDDRDGWVISFIESTSYHPTINLYATTANDALKMARIIAAGHDAILNEGD